MVARQLPAALLVACRRYLMVVTRPMPAAALVVRRRYLIEVDQAVARGGARCAPMVLARGTQDVIRGAVALLKLV